MLGGAAFVGHWIAQTRHSTSKIEILCHLLPNAVINHHAGLAEWRGQLTAIVRQHRKIFRAGAGHCCDHIIRAKVIWARVMISGSKESQPLTRSFKWNEDRDTG
ncbi:MAG: hypothetical protein EB121_09355 [Alphaproteobacteria bacterium]|nr:hypothetical protein [Alphaproteobacteria bacterium]